MTAPSSDNPILSAATHAYLSGLCDASGVVWTEAGMDYSISTQPVLGESANADTHSLEPRHEHSFSPTATQIDAVARFLQGATGDLEHRFTTSRHRDIARSFLKRLYDDLDYHELTITFSEHKTGADASFEMQLRRTSVLLKIGWAVD